METVNSLDILPEPAGPDAASGSLLAAVRTHLAMNSSDSDRSLISSPAVPDNRPAVPATKVEPTTEPFPEYYECESPDSIADPQHEDAYNYAISKVVQEVIKFQEVDAQLVSLPPFVVGATSPNLTLGSVDGVDCLTVDHKHRTLNQMKQLLSMPHLRPETRRRFVALTNIVLRLNYVLFHRVDGNVCKIFLGAQDTTDAQKLANTVLIYLVWLDDMMQENVQVATNVSYILGHIAAEDDDETVYVRYRRMATVVIAHLKKPRLLERQLLSVYLELYEAWVHTTFLRLRNRQILREDIPNTDRMDLSRHLLAIWDVMTRCIDNYSIYTFTTCDIRDRYLEPTMKDLLCAPDIWPQCWEMTLEGHDEEKEKEKKAKEGAKKELLKVIQNEALSTAEALALEEQQEAQDLEEAQTQALKGCDF
ncbi:hypothetical protein N7510_006895 [Penicillium lagena]|uniref:uncharacterized protein n=1 Tax=Penicillium lagena TaxID=94218 RepID=UPI00253FF976|nr:uncharacterized protein N7510_006895 [Penicillium lagena]KAJ5610176.1 hypothetical protein N7510_006895 [Penicillium lagena]